MVVSSRAMIFVYVNHGLVGQFSRGEYSTGTSPSAAIYPVAVKALQVPGQRRHDQRLRIQLDYCRTPVRCPSKLSPFLTRVGRVNRM